MFKNPRRSRQVRNFTTNVPKILDLKSSSEQIFSKNWRWVPLSGLIHNKNTSDSDCLLGRSARLIQVGFTQNVGWNLGLIQVHFFFQNNQQANGVEGEQQSENMQEVTKNSN